MPNSITRRTPQTTNNWHNGATVNQACAWQSISQQHPPQTTTSQSPHHKTLGTPHPRKTLVLMFPSWAAIGIGRQMAHSLMFIIAQNNGNVSLSVRLTPYFPPPPSQPDYSVDMKGPLSADRSEECDGDARGRNWRQRLVYHSKHLRPIGRNFLEWRKS